MIRAVLQALLFASLLASPARAQSADSAASPEMARLAGGGTALVSEGHSAGLVGGELRWLITIWWDPGAGRYRFLTCFKVSADAGCVLRGTAHWVGDTFVNDYEDVVDGRRTKMQDVWTDITPTSYTLTEAHDAGHGVMRPYVVSRSTRAK